MYERELLFLKETLRSANELHCNRSFCVSDKGEFDVVTDVDRKIETYFSERLKLEFPEDRLLGEEFSSQTVLSDRTWILDPIDGTYNFSTHSPHFGHQAALWDQGKLCISVIYLPYFDEMYEAKRGEGAFCNGKPISVSSRKAKDAIISFGDYPHHRPSDAKDQKKVMECAFPKVARMRMFGAASVDFAYLASGRTEGVVLFTKNKWDIAPGWLLAQEAGAVVFGPEKEEYSFESQGILAFNRKELYFEIMEGCSEE